ncbi:ABC transporter permease subunit [Oceanicella sp. SM1341]|uniref:ABC transporter permease subunit n=1 Tax=Oceanicella sp. SM1341 TaxID=1548889 RepID=UPI000E4D2F55|nr:ABC transporter permease subunit [Oceanicella sp. SM1341]
MSDTPGRSRIGKRLVIGIPMVWLLLFFLIPFAIVLKVSLSEGMIAQPPYGPILEWSEDSWLPAYVGSLFNYEWLLDDPLYITAYLNSIWMALVSTFFCLVIAYPMAYLIARSSPSTRTTLLMLVVLPFWTSSLLRIYALLGLLSPNGYINTVLQWLGVIDAPLQMLQTDFAVYLGIVFTYLPLMVLPLYATLEKLDESLLEASADLGASGFGTFWQVTLPLSGPGIAAGCLLVFIPAVGEYVIPALMGGPDQLMIGKVLYTEFFGNRDWPVASAVAIAMLAFLVIPFMMLRNSSALRGEV